MTFSMLWLYNVPDPVDDQNVYDLAVAALDEHFQPQNNAAFERSQFRTMVQFCLHASFF
jgi:hypothetical protein